jgi:hypothetical protein
LNNLYFFSLTHTHAHTHADSKKGPARKRARVGLQQCGLARRDFDLDRLAGGDVWITLGEHKIRQPLKLDFLVAPKILEHRKLFLGIPAVKLAVKRSWDKHQGNRVKRFVTND